MMFCWTGAVWCCEFSWCVNGASPVGCVFSLFYLYTFQTNPVIEVFVLVSDKSHKSK